MPIPELDALTGNLPPGVHDATWDELLDAFGFNGRRAELLQGLREALESLARAGCKRAYIDGSFVTAKERPGDFDGCWETPGVDPTLLDPELLELLRRRSMAASSSLQTWQLILQAGHFWSSFRSTGKDGPRVLSRSIQERCNDHK